MQKTSDLNTFPLESRVSIPGVEDYENIVIKRISDSGVTVTGLKCGNNVVISGRTPAVFYNPEQISKVAVESDGETIKQKDKIMTTENKNEVQAAEVVSNRAKRGSIKAKMAAIQVPANPFTVKQLAELNGIPAAYANQWVKENAKAAGNAEKVEGKRGRVAALFAV